MTLPEVSPNALHGLVEALEHGSDTVVQIVLAPTDLDTGAAAASVAA